MPPPVSVCLTTYNRGPVLALTLDSILAQKMGDFELIVNDDGSKDSTEEVCRDYEARDSRVRYYRNPRNLKMPGNLNAAIERSSGALVANLHDGDVYDPELLLKWKNALDENPDAAFVFNALESLDRDGKHACFHTHPFGSRIEVLDLTRYMLTRLDSPVWGTVMARRSAYDRSGLFRSEFGFISDVEMWMRLNLDYPVAYLSEPLISITPREVTHPYAYIDWKLEQILIRMHADVIGAMGKRGLIDVDAALSQLESLKTERWSMFAASCLKRRNRPLYTEALRLFRSDESLMLQFIGWAGLAAVPLTGSVDPSHS